MTQLQVVVLKVYQRRMYASFIMREAGLLTHRFQNGRPHRTTVETRSMTSGGTESNQLVAHSILLHSLLFYDNFSNLRGYENAVYIS